MITPADDTMIMPKSAALSFQYEGQLICNVPLFLLVHLAKNKPVTAEYSDLFNTLIIAPELIDDTEYYRNKCVELFLSVISWEVLEPYIACPPFLKTGIKCLWTANTSESGPFRFALQFIELPRILFRYMSFNEEYIRNLLMDGKLFMPCPAMFNDPFDCSLDESIRLTFIESAIGCFSTVPDSVLMFSHYADNHRGICVGFDAQLLAQSLGIKNHPWTASIRPVWYLAKMPSLNLKTHPALCASCKDDIWCYEREFRIFMNKGSSLKPSGLFEYDRTAVSEIIYGCKTSDETVALCKSWVGDLSSVKHQKATQLPNQFGVHLHAIHKI